MDYELVDHRGVEEESGPSEQGMTPDQLDEAVRKLMAERMGHEAVDRFLGTLEAVTEWAMDHYAEDLDKDPGEYKRVDRDIFRTTGKILGMSEEEARKTYDLYCETLREYTRGRWTEFRR